MEAGQQAPFVVLEGLDGSGITTQVELLRTWCERKHVDVFVTKEPSNGPVGSLLKIALEKRLAFSPEVMALLFTADRLDHLQYDIVPKLSDGVAVISDRYYLSTYAYQQEQVDLEWLRVLNSRCRRPDATVFLDVPVELCLQRWRADAWRSHDRLQLYEDEATLLRVRQNYLEMARILRSEGEFVTVVGGTGTYEEIHLELLRVVEPILEGVPSSFLRSER